MIDLLARSASEGAMFGMDPCWRFGLVRISLDRVILSAFLLSLSVIRKVMLDE